MYLFLAVVGHHCCTGFSLVVVHVLLIAGASFAAKHWLKGMWASVVAAPGLWSTVSRGSVAMWDLPRPGMEPMSPVLVGGSFTTEPPGKPRISLPFKEDSTFSGPPSQFSLFNLLYSFLFLSASLLLGVCLFKRFFNVILVETEGFGLCWWMGPSTTGRGWYLSSGAQDRLESTPPLSEPGSPCSMTSIGAWGLCEAEPGHSISGLGDSQECPSQIKCWLFFRHFHHNIGIEHIGQIKLIFLKAEWEKEGPCSVLKSLGSAPKALESLFLKEPKAASFFLVSGSKYFLSLVPFYYIYVLLLPECFASLFFLMNPSIFLYLFNYS